MSTFWGRVGGVSLLLVAGCAMQMAGKSLAPIAEPSPSPTRLVAAGPTATPTGTPTPEASQDAATTSAEAASVSFLKDVQPLLQIRCEQCHGDSWSTYHGARDHLDQIIGAVSTGIMPRGGPRFTPEEVQVLRDWQAEGAPQN